MKKALPILILSLFAPALGAQNQPPSPENIQQMMQSQMQMMVPMFGEMVKIMMNAQFDVLSQPETAEKLAKYTKNYYEALISAGFTKQEALEITKSMGIPTAPMMGK